MCCGNANKTKIKSGKFMKSHVNIVKQEVWPHTVVSKKYFKRASFDQLEFEAFVAGESRILYTMVADGDPDVVGRLRVLTLVAHWMGKTKNWPLIRSFYESIMEEIELGEKVWTDDFSGYETMLPSIGSANVGVIPPEVRSVKKSGYKVYWCKQFQMGNCHLGSPHMAQIKPEETPVPVLHICAFCWSNGKKRKEHTEMDCMSKK